jgi:hypothetical protein
MIAKKSNPIKIRRRQDGGSLPVERTPQGGVLDIIGAPSPKPTPDEPMTFGRGINQALSLADYYLMGIPHTAAGLVNAAIPYQPFGGLSEATEAAERGRSDLAKQPFGKELLAAPEAFAGFAGFGIPNAPQAARAFAEGAKETGRMAERAIEPIYQAMPENAVGMAGGKLTPRAVEPVELDPLGYYSRALESAKNLRQEKGTPEQMLSQMNVKQSEMEATGLADFLKDKPTVTKSELIDYLRNNRTQIQEHVYAPQSAGDASLPPTVHDRFTFDPTNPSNREVVFSVPPKSKNDWVYQDPHFGAETNAVGNILTTEVRTREKEPVFLVSQIQSQFGQDIRDYGLKDNRKIRLLSHEIEELQNYKQKRVLQASDSMDELGISNPEGRYVPEDIGDVWSRLEQALNDPKISGNAKPFLEDIKKSLLVSDQEITAQIKNKEKEKRDAMRAPESSHPIVGKTNTWLDMLLSRALRRAADSDAEYFAVPSGETVLSYNPVSPEVEKGMKEFYNDFVPKNLKNLMKVIDPKAAKPIREDQLLTSEGNAEGQGFTLFKLTPEMKDVIKKKGFEMYRATGGSVTDRMHRARKGYATRGAVEALLPEDQALFRPLPEGGQALRVPIGGAPAPEEPKESPPPAPQVMEGAPEAEESSRMMPVERTRGVQVAQAKPGITLPPADRLMPVEAAPAAKQPVIAPITLPPAERLVPISGAQMKKPEEEMPWLDVVTGAIKNIGPSTYEFGKNMVLAAIHPIDTATSLGAMAYGLTQQLGRIGYQKITGQEIEPFEYEKYAQALEDHFAKRYGSVESAKRTFSKDPIGFLADASMALTVGGFAAARLPGVAGKVGEAVQLAGRAIDPMKIYTEAVKLPFETFKAVREGLREAPPAPKQPVPEAALAEELGLRLFKGQATQVSDDIRYLDMAARGAYGPGPQAVAEAAFREQYDNIQRVGKTIAESVGTQREAAINDLAQSARDQISYQADRARKAQQASETAAESEAAGIRSDITGRGAKISEELRQGRPEVREPTEAAEIASRELRAEAQAKKAEYKGLYEEALTLPGEIKRPAIENLGTTIREDILRSGRPIEITKESTPISQSALDYINKVENLDLVNSVDPLRTAKSDIIAVNLKGIDQARKVLVQKYTQARSKARSTGDYTEQNAMAQIIDGFDNSIEKAMRNGLYHGDPRALKALLEARQSFSEYRKTFRPVTGDRVTRIFDEIIRDARTPEEVSRYMIGTTEAGMGGEPVRVAQRMIKALGPDSDAVNAVRQATWNESSAVRNARTGEIDPIKTADRVEMLANSSLGNTLYPKKVLDAMKDYARGIRDMESLIEKAPSRAAAEKGAAEFAEKFQPESMRRATSQGTLLRDLIAGTATPEQVTNHVFYAIRNNSAANVAKFIDAVRNIDGNSGQAMKSIRQGIVQSLIEGETPQAIVANIDKFLAQKSLANAVFYRQPKARELLGKYRDAVSLTVIPKYARTGSDTAIALGAMLRKQAASATESALEKAVKSATGDIPGGKFVTSLLFSMTRTAKEARKMKAADREQLAKVAEQIHYPPTPSPETGPGIVSRTLRGIERTLRATGRPLSDLGREREQD